MPDSDNNKAYSSLIELLKHWQAGGSGSVGHNDIHRLEQFKKVGPKIMRIVELGHA